VVLVSPEKSVPSTTTVQTPLVVSKTVEAPVTVGTVSKN